MLCERARRGQRRHPPPPTLRRVTTGTPFFLFTTSAGATTPSPAPHQPRRSNAAPPVVRLLLLPLLAWPRSSLLRQRALGGGGGGCTRPLTPRWCCSCTCARCSAVARSRSRVACTRCSLRPPPRPSGGGGHLPEGGHGRCRAARALARRSSPPSPLLVPALRHGAPCLQSAPPHLSSSRHEPPHPQPHPPPTAPLTCPDRPTHAHTLGQQPHRAYNARGPLSHFPQRRTCRRRRPRGVGRGRGNSGGPPAFRRRGGGGVVGAHALGGGPLDAGGCGRGWWAQGAPPARHASPRARTPPAAGLPSAVREGRVVPLRKLGEEGGRGGVCGAAPDGPDPGGGGGQVVCVSI